MGCGCNKNKLANRNISPRPGLVARQNPRTVVPAASVQARNSGKPPLRNLNNSGIAAERKKIQEIKRNNILRNLGRTR